MSDELKPANNEQEKKVVEFKDFADSQEMKDHNNTLKGQWAEEFRAKESDSIRASIIKENEDAAAAKALTEKGENLAQTTAREFADYKAAAEAKEARHTLKDNLVKKASELKADVGRVDLFLNYGDKAEEMFVQDHNYIQSKVNAGIDAKVKGSLSTDEPKSSEEKAATDDFEARMKKSMTGY